MLLSCIISGLVACALGLLFVTIVFLSTLTWMTRHELSIILFAGLLSALCLGTMGLWEVFITRQIQLNSEQSLWQTAWDIGLLAGIATSSRLTGAIIGLTVSFSYKRIIGYTSVPLFYIGLAVGTTLGYGIGYLCERLFVSLVESRIASRRQ